MIIQSVWTRFGGHPKYYPFSLENSSSTFHLTISYLFVRSHTASLFL